MSEPAGAAGSPIAAEVIGSWRAAAAQIGAVERRQSRRAGLSPR